MEVVHFTGGIVTNDLNELKEEIQREAKYLLNTTEQKKINININVERVEVGEYIWTNQYNISDEEAKVLAKDHNFDLSEIDWDNRDFECAARGYRRK